MSTLTNEQIDSFVTFINNHDFFIVSGHKDPDGDSLMSCLGVSEILKNQNKSFQLVSVGPFKRTEIKKFEKLFYSEFHIPQKSAKPALIIVDCSELDRLGEIFEDLEDIDTFIIDHHRTSKQKIPNSIIDSKSPATTYLIQQLYESMIGKLDKKTAEHLFFGLCTDTGFFKFLDTESADVFQAASRLVQQGANPRLTYSEINSGKPFSTRKLMGLMLERAEQKFNGKLIVTYETLEDTQKYGHCGRDSDSLYQVLLSVEGVKAVLFVRQDTDKTCTAGFRSKDDVDVSAIAAKFGGGGHKNAAGLSINGLITELMPKIIQEFSKIL